MTIAFFTAAAGLRNHQSKMDVIANNIANVNTTGYKTSQMSFASMLSQTVRGASGPSASLGGTNPMQVGLGAFVSAITSNMEQSPLENTNRVTDVAINGNGFFITNNGDKSTYTRAGNFGLDSLGYLVTVSGMKVQGYNQLTKDGLSIDSKSPVGDMVIPLGKKIEAKSTDKITFFSNLDADSNRWGTPKIISAGSTGLISASGDALPIAKLVGEKTTALAAGVSTTPNVDGIVQINGINIHYTMIRDFVNGLSSVDVAQTIADRINSNVASGTTINVVGSASTLPPTPVPTAADTFDIDGTRVALTGFPGDAGSLNNAIFVANRINQGIAQASAIAPCGFGAGSPVNGDTFDINGVTVTIAGFADAGNAAANAVQIAANINATAGLGPAVYPNGVTAVANANGTISLKANQFGQPITVSNFTGTAQNTGLASITDGDSAAVGIQVFPTKYINATANSNGTLTLTHLTPGQTLTISNITETNAGSLGLSSIYDEDTVAANIQMNANTIYKKVQATVREENNYGKLILQAVGSGDQFTIDPTAGITAVNAGLSSLTALTTIKPKDLPDIDLAGKHTLTVIESKAAEGTTLTQVGFGTGFTPASSDSFIINGIRVTLTGFVDSGSSSGNSAQIAKIINTTAGITVDAIANSNGTLTLKHKLAGENNTIEITGIAETNPGSTGLGSITDADNNAANGIQITNGVNASITDTFKPADNSPAIVRFYEDIVAPGSASNLKNVQNVISGSASIFPLIPGVVLSYDELKAGTSSLETAKAAEYTTNRVVYDSLGNSHDLTITFSHEEMNYWSYIFNFPKEPEIDIQNNTGNIKFDPNGLINTPNPINPLVFTASGAQTNNIEITWDGDGDLLGGITQFTGDFTTTIKTQNGYSFGVLEDFEIDQIGIIRGFYSNGQNRPIGQLALALFTNPSGLSSVGDTAYDKTVNSGEPTVLKPTTGSAGSIFGGFVEQSNVDLALEFTQLIITQRGLQANSRVFTAQDEILNEVVNLKR